MSPFENCQEVDQAFIASFVQFIEFYSKCINCVIVQREECFESEVVYYQFYVSIFSVGRDNPEELIQRIAEGSSLNYEERQLFIQILEINEEDVRDQNITSSGQTSQTLIETENNVNEAEQLSDTCPDSNYDFISEGCLSQEGGLFSIPLGENEGGGGADEVESVEQEIVGGTAVDPERYPYMMSLQLSTLPEGCFDARCGGTLVAADLVLTAAHCLYQIENEYPKTGLPPLELFVARAPRCRHESGPSPRSAVIFQYVHPNFTIFEDNSFAFDVALLRISNKFPPPFINIDTSQTIELVNNEVLSIIGYGVIADPDADPYGEGGIYTKQQLQLGRVQYKNNTECQDIVESIYSFSRSTITEDKLCVDTFDQGIVDACIGDSGGPIMVDGADATQDIQVGITSYGFRYVDYYGGGTFRCGGTTVYTRLSEVIPWIYEALPEVQEIQLQLRPS
eukprot:TRINITY_DN8876_c0_g1_i13.p1 TRINITY_DN8876_c0_g1~~TRINITY_DN8876_c0_g1_i13.p1  ORF type:complete len:527 (+),score=74.26 TRINITY_DN8876_c0_g1_i13:228-1583(+)